MPEFETWCLAPNDVKKVMGAFLSPYGAIKSSWKINNGEFELEVLIPVNTTAEIFLPGSKTSIKTGSGTYTYKTKLK